VLAIFEKHGFAGAADIGEIVAPAAEGVRLEVI
jgi:selenide, water dikinase